MTLYQIEFPQPEFMYLFTRMLCGVWFFSRFPVMHTNGAVCAKKTIIFSYVQIAFPQRLEQPTGVYTLYKTYCTGRGATPTCIRLALHMQVSSSSDSVRRLRQSCAE